MTDQAEPLAAHVALFTIAHDLLVPLREPVDSAPRRLLLHGDVAGHVVRRKYPLAPITQLESRYQLDLETAAAGVRAWRLAVIMIRNAANETKTNPAGLEEFQCLGA